jgi:tetratricopeptide (TPR) repeat protein
VTELSTRAALFRTVQLRQAGDCTAALRQAAQVARSASRLRHARGAAAMIVFDCGPDAETSLPALEQALAAHPNHLNLLLAVGARRMQVNRLEDAERAYRAATDIVPDLARPWTGLAMVQARRGDRLAAGESCSRALGLDPDFTVARDFCEANELVRPAP